MDHREHLLLLELGNISTLTGPPILVEALAVGDIAIHVIGGRCLALFERKTIADLAASIKDGRYKSQHENLKVMRQERRVKVFYIIEGPYRFRPEVDDNHGIHKSSLNTFMINTMTRDDIGVVRTNDVRDTADFIVAAFSRMQAHPEDYDIDAGASTEVGACRVAAADVPLKTRTRDECFINQLRQVPGISTKSAEAIQRQLNVSSILEMGCRLHSMAGRVRELYGITTVDTATGALRRVSRSAIDRLIAFMF